MRGIREHDDHDTHWPQYSTEVAHHFFVTCFLFLLISQSFCPESCHPSTLQLHSLIPSFICPVFITPPPDWAKGGNWEQSMWSPSQTLHCRLVRSHYSTGSQEGRHTAPVCHSLYLILLVNETSDQPAIQILSGWCTETELREGRKLQRKGVYGILCSVV